MLLRTWHEQRTHPLMSLLVLSDLDKNEDEQAINLGNKNWWQCKSTSGALECYAELMNLFLPSCESHFPDKCTHLTFSFGLNEENTIVAFRHRLFKLGFTMESSFSLVNSHFVFPSLNAWRSIIMQAKIFVLWFIRPPLYPMNARDHMSGAMHTPTFLPWDMSDADENDNDQSIPYNRV